MPQKRAAYKDIRETKKRHLRNIKITSELKTLIKRFNLLLIEKKLDQAKEFLKTVSSKLNKAATKGVIHKNAAARRLSRLSKKLHRVSDSH